MAASGRGWRHNAAPHRRPRPHRWRHALGLLTFVALLLVVAASLAGGGGAVAAYQLVFRDLPPVDSIPARPQFKTTQILDRHGTLLFEIFDQDAGKRTLVRLADMPHHLIDATVATEDASFFNHLGVDPRGIARAAWSNLTAGRLIEGGSTITQQLVKNVLIPPDERYETSFGRKLREAALAFQVNQSYSKEQILEMYLNEIYYGNLAYGVEAAALSYFGKSVADLSLAEAAMLAGLPQAPALYDPFKDPAAAKQRQGQVLDAMVRHGMLDEDTAAAAREEPLQYTPSDSGLVAPHFVWYVRDLLAERFGQRGLLEGGFRVHTTLDLEVQTLAEEVVAQHAATLARQDARNAALVAIDPRTGELLAMVGSAGYYNVAIDGQVNATLADRQPGSAIKPLVYLAAFQRGFGPATVVVDQRTQFPDGPGRTYAPDNFDRRFRGPVTLRRALGNSLNVPAVKVLQYAGIGDSVRLARALGITSLSEEQPYGLSFTLGGTEVKLLELAGAYAALANAGRIVPVDPIVRIEDAAGSVVAERPAPSSEPAFDPRLAFLVTDVLADNEARRETFGPDSPLRLSRPAAVKTGSTDDYRDSWTIGYTPSLLAGVWVGNSDGRPMRLVLGSSGAGAIWHDFMERQLEGQPAEPFAPPAGLIRAPACAATGFAPGPECRAVVTDWFLAERPPRAANAARIRVAVNGRSNKLATAYCPLPEIAFRTFGGTISGEGPYPPVEYCDLHGPESGRPVTAWELAPTPTRTPTPLVPTATAASSPIALGATPARLPTWTPTRIATLTPTATVAPATTPGLLSARLAPAATAIPPPTAVAPKFHPWAHLPREVKISHPEPGQAVDGIVTVLGSASIGEFDRYGLQYGEGTAPSQWHPAGPPRTQPVNGGVLETWDTTPLSEGTYTLALVVLDSSGQQITARQQVAVRHTANPLAPSGSR